MDSGNRPGCRDNGLPAERFVALVDLDPRVADALLTSLRAAGVAAYAAPPATQDPVTRSAHSPALRDRVYVDAEAREAARRVLAEEAPDAAPVGEEPRADRDEDMDAAWRAIVADLSGPTPAGERPWPTVEDVDPAPFRSWSPPPDPEDEHYVPPPPPPLPRWRPVTLVASLAVLAGLLLLVLPTAMGNSLDDSTAMLAVLLMVGGVGTLVYRMRDPDPTDHDPDDGAVV